MRTTIKYSFMLIDLKNYLQPPLLTHFLVRVRSRFPPHRGKNVEEFIIQYKIRLSNLFTINDNHEWSNYTIGGTMKIRRFSLPQKNDLRKVASSFIWVHQTSKFTTKTLWVLSLSNWSRWGWKTVAWPRFSPWTFTTPQNSVLHNLQIYIRENRADITIEWNVNKIIFTR